MEGMLQDAGRNFQLHDGMNLFYHTNEIDRTNQGVVASIVSATAEGIPMGLTNLMNLPNVQDKIFAIFTTRTYVSKKYRRMGLSTSLLEGIYDVTRTIHRDWQSATPKTTLIFETLLLPDTKETREAKNGVLRTLSKLGLKQVFMDDPSFFVKILT